MFKITPIRSGSSGNSYLFEDINILKTSKDGFPIEREITTILIECGIPFKTMKQWLLSHKKSLYDVSGCLVSHEHGDHLGCAQSLLNEGVNVYASGGTIKAAGLKWANKVRAFKDIKKPVRIGRLNIYAFNVVHDAAEPFAYVLDSENERLLYITDTPTFPFSLDSVSHLMIECNYDPVILEKNVNDGIVDASLARRIETTHMSINVVEKILEKMDKHQLKEVWLMHLSDDNSDAEDFLRRVSKIAGCDVFIC